MAAIIEMYKNISTAVRAKGERTERYGMTPKIDLTFFLFVITLNEILRM